MNKIRILIANDHAVVRHGLKLVLRQEPDFEIVGEAKNGLDAISMIYDMLPNVALLDWKMPRLDGLQTAAKMKQSVEWIRTLILSGAPVEAAALDALENGVDGFVHKDVSPQGLAHAIRTVAAGKRYLGPEISQALLERSRQQSKSKDETVALSPCELEILRLMATAVTYKEMGAQLSISETTVHTYVKRIFAKLKQPNRTQAVIAAFRLKLIDLDLGIENN